MSTDWVQVVVSLVWGVGIGTLIIRFAVPITDLQRKLAQQRGRPEWSYRRMRPPVARAVGVGFILIGIAGAVLGLFFADQM